MLDIGIAYVMVISIVNLLYIFSNKSEGLGFSGEITIYSEMKPCESCAKIMTDQFRNYFGNDIRVNIKYGVEYP